MKQKFMYFKNKNSLDAIDLITSALPFIITLSQTTFQTNE